MGRLINQVMLRLSEADLAAYREVSGWLGLTVSGLLRDEARGRCEEEYEARGLETPWERRGG